MDKEYIIDTDSDVGMRLDVYLANQPDNPSRANIQKMISENAISVNNIAKKANYKLRLNDVIVMNYQEPQEIDVVAEDIPLDILYEDKDIIVINVFPSETFPGPLVE